MSLPCPIPIEEILKARERLAGKVLRTPLIRYYSDNHDQEIYLKAENLQPIGSFKLRGAINAMLLAKKEALKDGVLTASAGNMAQGVAWSAKEMGIPCKVIVPDHAPETKLKAITKLGGSYIKVPFAEWWDVLITRTFPGQKGFFIHPVCDVGVIAGNATIGLEIMEDLPDVDQIIVPYGGGGLSTGIASAVKAMKSEVEVYGSEVATAAPLFASLQAGKPVEVKYTASFVDGIGGKDILREMWPLASTLLDGSIVASLQDVATALKEIALRNRMIVEGAGASSLAAALKKSGVNKKTVCVLSGGNIDPGKLGMIMNGKLP